MRLRRLATVGRAGLEDRLHLGVEGARAQVEVDEAGARDLDLVDLRAVGQRVDDAGRDLASRIATLQAKSPWSGSRVRSTVLSTDSPAAASARSGCEAMAWLTSSATMCFIA